METSVPDPKPTQKVLGKGGKKELWEKHMYCPEHFGGRMSYEGQIRPNARNLWGV